MPLANMFGYINTLRSSMSTGARAIFDGISRTMRKCHVLVADEVKAKFA